jgi:hypothetical protein
MTDGSTRTKEEERRREKTDDETGPKEKDQAGIICP